MRFKIFAPVLLTFAFFAIALPVFPQVAPSYQPTVLAWTLGIGPSSYDVDWGQGRMYGGTIWLDMYPASMSAHLPGLGLEAEARDISLHRNGAPQINQRQDTAGGGLFYSISRFHYFRPFGKFLVEDGSVDYYPSPPQSHDTRIVLAPGLGFEARLYKPLWARVDYEYQAWKGPLLGTTLNPQGFTIGFAYDLSRYR